MSSSQENFEVQLEEEEKMRSYSKTNRDLCEGSSYIETFDHVASDRRFVDN